MNKATIQDFTWSIQMRLNQLKVELIRHNIKAITKSVN